MYCIAKIVNLEDFMSDSVNHPITVEEAATFLGYTKSYVYRLIHDKRISYYKPGGSHGARVFFKQADLEAFAYRGRCSADFELAMQAEEILISQQTRKKRK
jgi:excisionase family DNA binding protein